MIKNKILEVLKEPANLAISFQEANGSFPAGHNGPYFDQETPVRNTAHFLKLFLNLYKTNKDPKYKEAAEGAISFLLAEGVKPEKYTYHCRNNSIKDKCNGLVGQAWVIEAFVLAYEVLNNKECLDEALRIYQLHRQCKSTGVWYRLEIDGQELPIDPTFNHQLWFCAVAALLSRHEKNISADVTLFIKVVLNNLETYSDGVIFHASRMGPLNFHFKLGFLKGVAQLRLRLRRLTQRKALYQKSVGYHGFNLHAIAMIVGLKEYKSDVEIKVLSRVQQPIESDIFKAHLAQNEYGYFYNVTGFEIAYFCKELQFNDDVIDKWIELQLKHTKETNSKLLTSGAKDKNTALARVYQLSEIL